MANEKQYAETTLRILSKLLGGQSLRNAGIRLWDGRRWPDETPRQATIVLNHPGALKAMFQAGTETGLAESYIYGDFDVEGDFEAAFELPEALQKSAGSLEWKLRAARAFLSLPGGSRRPNASRGPARLSGKRHTKERDRQAISYHYDVSNEFYTLWLDRRMVYSCAYFTSDEDDLDNAQLHKLEYICRKLRLRPGQKFLDIGCGWGGLIMHAARNFGVDATGITLSGAQAELAGRRIAEAGLSERCRVLLCDYREMDGAEKYDAISSVGMFEHVGEKRLAEYFAIAMRLLKPCGVFLNHGIAERTGEKSEGPSFSNTYIFPDGELVPLNTTLRTAEEAGFEVRDVESLREHYARTTRLWAERLNERHGQVLRYVDEPTYRVWHLLMRGSVHGFGTGSFNLYQSLLCKTGQCGVSGLPLTRADWYGMLAA
jgi:cyclopropane-fatty-acyl-phospholipid synthase